MGDVIGKCTEHRDSDVVLIKDRMNIRITCTTEGCKNDFRLNINGLIQPTEKTCPECGLPQIKVIRRGQSPETKCADPKCIFNTEKENMGKCPSDSGNLVVRQSRYGKRFLGCSNYPDCTVTYPLPQMGVVKFSCVEWSWFVYFLLLSFIFKDVSILSVNYTEYPLSFRTSGTLLTYPGLSFRLA